MPLSCSTPKPLAWSFGAGRNDSQAPTRHASRVVSDVRRSGRPVIVTVNGQPAAVVLPLKTEDLEDFVLSYDEQFVRDRLAADAELAAGKTSSLEDVVAELDD
jgi:prevent-host-death family protein